MEGVPPVSARRRRAIIFASLIAIIVYLFIEQRYQTQQAQLSQQAVRPVSSTKTGPRRRTPGQLPPAPGLPTTEQLLYTAAGHHHLAARSLPKEQLAPLTAEVQEFLYARQFPASCAGKKFLLSTGNEDLAGLGSHVHISTLHLTIAIETGRIFLWHKAAGAVYTDAETCDGIDNFECFFAAPSNCTLADAEGPGSDTLVVSSGNAGDAFGLQFYHVPNAIAAMWRGAGMVSTFWEMRFWWRAQASAFLSRFNAKAIGILRQMRTNTTAVLFAANPAALNEVGGMAVAESFARAFPFPRGTVSIHIRHGDKSKEMSLVPSKRYFDAAEEMVRLNPFAVRRQAFVSTEDPTAIDEVKARGDAWTWMWWDVPRINSNGPDQLARLNLRRGELTFIWWLQLFMALECDAWVGTRGSNWNRLLDELRCIWLPKCNNPYTEVGDAESWKQYNWRR